MTFTKLECPLPIPRERKSLSFEKTMDDGKVASTGF
jgi:hypothetical protein